MSVFSRLLFPMMYLFTTQVDQLAETLIPMPAPQMFGLKFQGFDYTTANNVADLGVVPHSPPNYLAHSQESFLRAGGFPNISIVNTAIRSLQPQSFYAACELPSGQTDVNLPTTNCSIVLQCEKDGAVTGSQTFYYAGGGQLVGQMSEFEVDSGNIKDCTALTTYTLTDVGDVGNAILKALDPKDVVKIVVGNLGLVTFFDNFKILEQVESKSACPSMGG